jgi:midasin
LACVDVRIPILLQGPAAVGKTSLVKDLAAQRKIVYKELNNTETTSIQDYFGSYMPGANGSVEFKPGVLTECMQNGHWFLADEFNLAEAGVLTALYPVLEGANRVRVPGTDVIVTVHPSFAFFATQNAAGYANRKHLPLALRNRFVEIQVASFLL